MCRKPKGLRGKYCDLLSGFLRKIRATILTSSLLKQARLFDCDFSFHCETMFLRGEEMKTQEPEFDARIHSEFPEVKFMRKAISLAKKAKALQIQIRLSAQSSKKTARFSHADFITNTVNFTPNATLF